MKLTESERLSFREFSPEDAIVLQAIADHPEFSFVLLKQSDPNAGVALVAKCLSDAKLLDPVTHRRRNYRLAITREGRLIGYIGLFNIDFQKKDGEIGFFIAPQEQRKGYALEAVLAMMQVARGELGLAQFYATARTDNAASQSVLEKAGMVQAGTVPNKYGDDVATRLLFRTAQAS